MDLGVLIGIGDAVAIGVFAYVLRQRLTDDKRSIQKSLASIEGAVTTIDKLRLIPGPAQSPRVKSPAPGRHEFFRTGADHFECKRCGCDVECHQLHHEVIHTFRFDGCPSDKHWTVDRAGVATCK